MLRANTAHPAPWQELRLNSPVQCRDGPAGVLEHVCFYPCCGTLAQLVIRRPLFARPRRVVVSARSLSAITADGIVLDLSRAALAAFPFDTSRLLRMCGAERRAAKPEPTPSHASRAVSHECCAQTGAHTASGLLGNAMPVECEDGRAGRLAMVLLDPHTLRVLQLVIYRGRFVRRTTTVLLGWIESSTPRRIRLGAGRRQLEQLPPYHSDDEIAEDVRYGLRTAPAFRADATWLPIGVTAHDGVVLLHGNVRSAAQRYEAERIAQQTMSVRHVCNELIADDELQRRIERVSPAAVRDSVVEQRWQQAVELDTAMFERHR